ncbi:hypothetical protein NPIL_454161 [Nephila pilipes]|uniref:Uncharacterized protein n=1 Tax=Nephila pilipes TaxID=299642 RepID=A0A8X6MFJ0_NEPPI|nr:hypothetical protein NPIL_454161 [Nephila pilipes]
MNSDVVLTFCRNLLRHSLVTESQTKTIWCTFFKEIRAQNKTRHESTSYGYYCNSCYSTATSHAAVLCPYMGELRQSLKYMVSTTYAFVSSLLNAK